jgi:hypothetical protein
MKDSRLAVLESMIRLAGRITGIVKARKVLRGLDFWSYAYFARMADTAGSVVILLKAGRELDAKFLARTAFDAMWDFLYLCKNPSKPVTLLNLLYKEAVFDDHARLVLMAQLKSISPARLLKREHRGTSVLDNYERIQREIERNRLRGLRRRQHPILWRDIPLSEKVHCANDIGQSIKTFEYTIKTLGDASAHSRPEALQFFWPIPGRRNKKGRTHLNVTQWLYSKEWVAFEVALCLLIACDQMVDKWFPGTSLETKIIELRDRLKAMDRIKV